ncbi:hypothetical protein B0T16DRAFT_17530 [Cercophora newfieldiana]|uniref:Uncharacterized protein n=1 Tax=Cercophora newfieldiana TaxID=92897 RepID=A0AA40CZ04_9PEZI|nr:hypothetical protein B0T16DRAFT_17530 [Cercophora newfieldiana]
MGCIHYLHHGNGTDGGRNRQCFGRTLAGFILHAAAFSLGFFSFNTGHWWAAGRFGLSCMACSVGGLGFLRSRGRHGTGWCSHIWRTARAKHQGSRVRGVPQRGSWARKSHVDHPARSEATRRRDATREPTRASGANNTPLSSPAHETGHGTNNWTDWDRLRLGRSPWNGHGWLGRRGKARYLHYMAGWWDGKGWDISTGMIFLVSFHLLYVCLIFCFFICSSAVVWAVIRRRHFYVLCPPWWERMKSLAY